MDAIDRKIASLLQADARRSNADLAAATGLSVSAASERARRLVATGAIMASRAILDPDRFNRSLCGFIFVDLGPGGDEAGFCNAIAQMKEVQECHHVTGEHSYLLKVRVADTHELQTLLAERIKTRAGVMRTVSLISLSQVKETTEIDCGASAEAVG